MDSRHRSAILVFSFHAEEVPECISKGKLQIETKVSNLVVTVSIIFGVTWKLLFMKCEEKNHSFNFCNLSRLKNGYFCRCPCPPNNLGVSIFRISNYLPQTRPDLMTIYLECLESRPLKILVHYSKRTWQYYTFPQELSTHFTLALLLFKVDRV